MLKAFDGQNWFCPLHLWWAINGDTETFHINCNDLFWWATADAEDITPENICHIEELGAYIEGLIKDEATRDLEWVDELCDYSTALLVCRMRKMRPQNCFTKKIKHQKLREMFEACGPERSDEECG